MSLHFYNPLLYLVVSQPELFYVLNPFLPGNIPLYLQWYA